LNYRKSEAWKHHTLCHAPLLLAIFLGSKSQKLRKMAQQLELEAQHCCQQ